jgi:hypothetical protein
MGPNLPYPATPGKVIEHVFLGQSGLAYGYDKT